MVVPIPGEIIHCYGEWQPLFHTVKGVDLLNDFQMWIYGYMIGKF